MGATTEMVEQTFFAQPIVDIRTRNVLRYELLLRERSAGNWQLPVSFGLMFVTERTLLTRALQTLDTRVVDLNLTAAQFADYRFIQGLIDFKANSPLLATLTVELTTTPSLMVIQQVGPLLSRAGIHITIDDVGSDNLYGAVFETLPYVDGVKFAMQNMRAQGMAGDLTAQVSYWKRVADKYHLRFTLEGIENHTDVVLAERLRIVAGQGFYYGRPTLP